VTAVGIHIIDAHIAIDISSVNLANYLATWQYIWFHCCVCWCRYYWWYSNSASVPRSTGNVLRLPHASQVTRARDLLHRQDGSDATSHIEQESRVHESTECRS